MKYKIKCVFCFYLYIYTPKLYSFLLRECKKLCFFDLQKNPQRFFDWGVRGGGVWTCYGVWIMYHQLYLFFFRERCFFSVSFFKYHLSCCFSFSLKYSLVRTHSIFVFFVRVKKLAWKSFSFFFIFQNDFFFLFYNVQLFPCCEKKCNTIFSIFHFYDIIT